MYNLTGRSVALGVSGSIAAYKAADLASKLTQAGAKVDALLTTAAAEFIAPLTLQGVTGRPAYVDMFDTSSGASELHIELARRADALVIAPASATTVARVALGLAEDMVSLTALATRAPVIVCPAMDAQMYEHEATQGHLETLRLATVILAANEIDRPIIGTPGIPAERVKVLREAFIKSVNDPELLDDAKKKRLELDPVSGEDLPTLANEIVAQPPEVIERMKKLLGT